MNKNRAVIKLIKGDITTLPADAIVNAANSTLLGGGGVDGAIHRAGGPAILKACREIRAEHGELPVGEVVITTAGNLPAKYVIHTVGPVWHGGRSGEPEKLEACYSNSLNMAGRHGLNSIAFPNISTGVFGYPKEKAALTAIQTVRNADHHGLSEIIFVCFDDENYELYKSILTSEKRP
jgi:O-acetyl-ADP-ribose deacetylase (regulator of RNase III)